MNQLKKEALIKRIDNNLEFIQYVLSNYEYLFNEETLEFLNTKIVEAMNKTIDTL